jgi:mannose-6-phosphate isomerase-like protein (cupin superfamily)
MADFKDHGAEPFVTNIETDTIANANYRTALWTGHHFQITLMSIPVGEDIGLEIHPDTDQFLRIEQGRGRVQMGDMEIDLSFDVEAEEGFAIVVPAKRWHNVTNIGNVPLKIYSIYAPPHHPHGTIQATRTDADAAEAAETTARNTAETASTGAEAIEPAEHEG